MEPRVPVFMGIALFMLFTPMFATIDLDQQTFSVLVIATLWCYLLGLAGMFVVLVRSSGS